MIILNNRIYPDSDRDWTEDDWKAFFFYLINEMEISFEKVCSILLGELNPPQVATAIASNESFKSHYEKGKCWAATRKWFYNETGHCADCGTSLDLQADHIIPKEILGEDANYITNLTLRCRRCNVIKRPSHKNGGKTFLTAQSALMWILFTQKPTTYQEYEKLCREYGLTMSTQRFEEAWAMAIWLAKEDKYKIDPSSKFWDLWHNNDYE